MQFLAQAVRPFNAAQNKSTWRWRFLPTLLLALPLALIVSQLLSWILSLAEADPKEVTAAWRAGELIVVVRHAERCDRSDAPCVGPADGITQPGSNMATALGNRFDQLGLERATVYNSPATRTTQTANFMFKGRSQPQQWLADCRGNVLAHVQSHKVTGQNLVLVTHSECMDGLLESLDIHLDDDLDYGSMLFLRRDEASHNLTRLEAIGYMDSQDWLKPLLLEQTALIGRAVLPRATTRHAWDLISALPKASRPAVEIAFIP